MNLALYSNRIVPDRCLVHGGCNRSDVNASISAHFSPTMKSERDTLLRFVKVCGGCVQSISRRNVFQERFTWKAYSWLNYYNTEDRDRETIFQTTTPQGIKPCSILSKLQYCVRHEVLFFVEVSYVFIPRRLCDL